MTACNAPDEDPRNSTHYYCNHCNKEKYSYLERHGKWDEESCVAYGKPLPREYDWNDILGRGETCDTTCQYTILICNWWTNFRTTTNNYALLNKSKNNTSPKLTLTSVKTVLSHAKISAVKSVKIKET
ncbi:hypothetical protein G9A89_002114 [Geosiphon pyriformis]|nr:hypothetical protein G9A89_002114 [Geosiphon pyriformis]